MSTENKPTYVRLPPHLKQRLEQEARQNSRSLTNEIVYQLKRAYSLDEPVPNRPLKTFSGEA